VRIGEKELEFRSACLSTSHSQCYVQISQQPISDCENYTYCILDNMVSGKDGTGNNGTGNNGTNVKVGKNCQFPISGFAWGGGV